MPRFTVHRRLTAAALLAGTAVALAACSGPTTGDPAPSTTTAAPGSTGGSAPSSSSSASDPLASVDPCALIPPDRVAANKLVVKGPETVDGARGCSWNQPTGIDNRGFALGVRLYSHLSLDQAKAQAGAGNDVTETTVGSHQAIQIKVNQGDGAGSCEVLLKVTPASSVYVNADDAGGDAATSCQDATGAATTVEKNIPAESN
jgi:hypothetical protein